MRCLPVLCTFLCGLLQLIVANETPAPTRCVKRGLELLCPADTRVAITEPRVTPCDVTAGRSASEQAMWSQCNLKQGCGFEGMFMNELDVSYKCVPYIPGYVHDMCSAHIEDSPFLYLSSPHYASPSKRTPCVCGAFMTQPTNITIYISNDLQEDQELSIDIDGTTPIHITHKTPGREYGMITKTVRTFIKFGFVNGNRRNGGSFMLLYEIEGERTINVVCEKVSPGPNQPYLPEKDVAPPVFSATTLAYLAGTTPSIRQSTGGEEDNLMSIIAGAIIPLILIAVVVAVVMIFLCRRRRRRLPKKKSTGFLSQDPKVTNNLDQVRCIREGSSPDVMLNRTYGMLEPDSIISATRGRPQARDNHYACVNIEDKIYVNDLGEKYANVAQDRGGPYDSSVLNARAEPSGTSATGSRGCVPVPTPRTSLLRKGNAHFYSNLTKEDDRKYSNLEREELMKENSLLREIRDSLNERKRDSTHVPNSRLSQRSSTSEQLYSNLPENEDTTHYYNISPGTSADDNFLESSAVDDASGSHQLAIEESDEYQPIEFNSDSNIVQGSDDQSAKTFDTAPLHELHHSAQVANFDSDTVSLAQENDLYQPVDVCHVDNVEAIMKENDLYQPYNICRDTYTKHE